MQLYLETQVATFSSTVILVALTLCSPTSVYPSHAEDETDITLALFARSRKSA